MRQRRIGCRAAQPCVRLPAPFVLSLVPSPPLSRILQGPYSPSVAVRSVAYGWRLSSLSGAAFVGIRLCHPEVSLLPDGRDDPAAVSVGVCLRAGSGDDGLCATPPKRYLSIYAHAARSSRDTLPDHWIRLGLPCTLSHEFSQLLPRRMPLEPKPSLARHRSRHRFRPAAMGFGHRGNWGGCHVSASWGSRGCVCLSKTRPGLVHITSGWGRPTWARQRGVGAHMNWTNGEIWSTSLMPMDLAIFFSCFSCCTNAVLRTQDYSSWVTHSLRWRCCHTHTWHRGFPAAAARRSCARPLPHVVVVAQTCIALQTRPQHYAY